MRSKFKHPFETCKSSPLVLVFLVVVSFMLTFGMSIVSTAKAQIAEPEDSERQAERQLFIELEELIARRRFSEAQQRISELRDYPLFPYLELELLKNNLSVANEPLVEEFLSEYASTPMERELRPAWLRYLASNRKAEKFLHNYRPSGSEQLHCYYLRFSYDNLQDKSQIWPQVTEQYLSGRSVNSACDSTFANWAAAGHRTTDVVWARIGLALNARQSSLARYLVRYLPEDFQPYAHLYRRVYSTPSVAANTSNFSSGNRFERDIIVYGLNRYRWQNPVQAARAWDSYRSRFEFNPEQRQQMDADIAVSLALNNEESALSWFDQLEPADLSGTARHWHLAAMLQQRRFDRVLSLTTAMFDDNVENDSSANAQWIYWAARAYAELGFLDDAQAMMERAANTRSFYGFLASARLGQQPRLKSAQLDFDSDALHQVLEHPSSLRAYEFFRLGRGLEARREWNQLRHDLSEQLQPAIALLAHSWGWHDQAIFTLAQTDGRDYVQYRFPEAYSELIRNHAQQQQLDPAWMFAIARRESAFQVDAVSSAGARGLMQVMPSTADYVYRSVPGTQRVNAARLFNADDNVSIASRYLRDLLRRTDNNQVVATASYNAGYYRVQQWLSDTPVPVDIWIETMPYSETRDYVKAVLAYQQIYILLAGEERNIFAPLVNMQINGNSSG